MKNRPIIDVKKLRSKTQDRKKGIYIKKEQEAATRLKRICKVAKEEADRLIAELPVRLEEATQRGRDNIRIYITRIPWQEGFKPVDIIQLEELVVKDLCAYCHSQGLNARFDRGYPHSEDWYEEWIRISW